MSIHFSSMTVTEITDRAHKLMEEGTALALLANALTEFEEATGRRLFVSEADHGTQYVGTPAPVEFRSQTDRDKPMPEVYAKGGTGPFGTMTLHDVIAQEFAKSAVVPGITGDADGPDSGLTVSRLAVRVDTPAEPVAEPAPVQEPIKKVAPAIAKPVPPKPTRAQEPVKKPAPRPNGSPRQDDRR